MATLTPSDYSIYQSALSVSNQTPYTAPIIPSNVQDNRDVRFGRMLPLPNNKGVIKSEYVDAIRRSNEVTAVQMRSYRPAFEKKV